MQENKGGFQGDLARKIPLFGGVISDDLFERKEILGAAFFLFFEGFVMGKGRDDRKDDRVVFLFVKDLREGDRVIGMALAEIAGPKQELGVFGAIGEA